MGLNKRKISFFLPNNPSSFTAVSAVSGQFHRAVSVEKQFQEKFFVKVF